MQSVTITISLSWLGAVFALLTLCAIGYSLLSMLSVVSFLLSGGPRRSSVSSAHGRFLYPS